MRQKQHTLHHKQNDEQTTKRSVHAWNRSRVEACALQQHIRAFQPSSRKIRYAKCYAWTDAHTWTLACLRAALIRAALNRDAVRPKRHLDVAPHPLKHRHPSPQQLAHHHLYARIFEAPGGVWYTVVRGREGRGKQQKIGTAVVYLVILEV